MEPSIPEQPVNRVAIHLHPRAERAVQRGHPWVFAQGIRRQRKEGRRGDLAVLFDRTNRFLAVGLYDPDSPIRVRVLHRGEPEEIDRAWIAGRLRSSNERRAALPALDTTGYRVVHGENDQLAGLVVDRYDRSLVVKLYTGAWFPYLADILAELRELLHPERVVLRLSRAVMRIAAEEGDLHDGKVVHGPPLSTPVLFRENGLTFEADLASGQKTGFFLDQRDNRARLERACSQRRVLNVFAYTGGFSVYAARGGARTVTSLDQSEPALAAAKRNFRHNAAVPAVAAARHELLAGDAFDLLPALRRGGESYDVVVLDPPSFAKASAEVDRALRSYTRLVRMGLQVLSPGGHLMAASCSSRITAEQFSAVVQQTARRAGRPLDAVEQTGHALDHPIGFPEGEYLTTIFATAP